MRKVIRTAIFGCIIAVLIISLYVYLSKRTTSNEETAEPEKVTAMDEVLNKDFQEDYPGTPRSVIKWYNKIVKLYYNDDATDEQVIDLADKARELWDDELIDANPRDTYLTDEFTLSSSVSVMLAKKWHEKKSILKTNSETRLNVLLIFFIFYNSHFFNMYKSSFLYQGKLESCISIQNLYRQAYI